jgi:uncharacterized protein
MTDPGGFERDRDFQAAKSEPSVVGLEIDGVLGPIRGEVFRAHNPEATVVICHGFKGFARWGFFPHLAKEIAKAGLNAITFDFSGSGIGPDRENATAEELFTKNTFTAELNDLDRVIAAARASGWIAGKVGLFGHSRGGGVAILHAASDSEVGALVTWNSISYVRRWSDAEAKIWREHGFTDIENSRTGQVFKLGTALLDDVEANAKGSLDVEAAAARVKAPWLILHGKSDETVPSSEGERLHGAAKGSTMRIIEGNHGFDAKHPFNDVPPNLKNAVAQTVAFFQTNLAGA